MNKQINAKECLKDLFVYLEEINKLHTDAERGYMFKCIVPKLTCFLKLKELIDIDDMGTQIHRSLPKDIQ